MTCELFHFERATPEQAVKDVLPASGRNTKCIPSFIIISFLLLLPLHLLGQQVDSIKVFYLPWKFNIEGEITEELVRSYTGYSNTVSISDEIAMAAFLQAMSLVNLRPQANERAKFTPRMVIDVYARRSLNSRDFPFIQTFYLDSRQNLKHVEVFYYKNFELEIWLNKYIFRH